jgi:DNA-binding NarL/FixJ family response regulator
MSNNEIADELYLSVNTVRNHIQRISAKLGVSTRLEIAMTAIRRGLIELPQEETLP